LIIIHSNNIVNFCLKNLKNVSKHIIYSKSIIFFNKTIANKKNILPLHAQKYGNIKKIYNNGFN